MWPQQSLCAQSILIALSVFSASRCVHCASTHTHTLARTSRRLKSVSEKDHHLTNRSCLLAVVVVVVLGAAVARPNLQATFSKFVLLSLFLFLPLHLSLTIISKSSYRTALPILISKSYITFCQWPRSPARSHCQHESIDWLGLI